MQKTKESPMASFYFQHKSSPGQGLI